MQQDANNDKCKHHKTHFRLGPPYANAQIIICWRGFRRGPQTLRSSYSRKKLTSFGQFVILKQCCNSYTSNASMLRTKIKLAVPE